MNQLSEALVLVSYGSHGIVQCEDGTRLDCKYRRQVGRPYCGDRVRVSREGETSGVVELIHPRKNHFVRADPKFRQHIVAANLDQVIVTIAKRPSPSRDLLERYLLAVHSLDIQPVIVLNKVELSDPPDSEAGAKVISHLDDYRALGYTVIETSCKGPPGINGLMDLLRNRTSIFAGQSGVGKSSLVRKLLPDLDIQVGELSRVTGKGTHTTTTTTLYALPGGGHLMDSPGVWEYGLWKLENRDIVMGFIEFRPFLGQCRFNDCLHSSEPGCAIKQAVEEQQVLPWRYKSYLRLLEQNIQGF